MLAKYHIYFECIIYEILYLNEILDQIFNWNTDLHIKNSSNIWLILYYHDKTWHLLWLFIKHEGCSCCHKRLKFETWRYCMFVSNQYVANFYDFENFIEIEKEYLKLCNMPPDHMRSLWLVWKLPTDIISGLIQTFPITICKEVY